MKILKFIYKNLDHFKARLGLAFIMSIIDGVIVFMIPVFLAEFTKKDFTLASFKTLIILVIVFYMASLFSQWVIRKYGESLSTQFSNYIRLKYFKALKDLSYKDLISHHSGYTLSLINKFTDGLTQVMQHLYWTVAGVITSVILLFIYTARESLFIAVINIFILGLFLIISTLLSRKMVPLSSELNIKRASLLESYTDFMSNILTVKKLGIHSFAEGKLSKKTQDNYDQIRKLQNFHAKRWFLLHGLYGLAYLFTIVFILYQISRGLISPSVLILFIAAYALIRTKIERLSEVLKTMMEMKAYLDNLDKIIVLKGEKDKKRENVEWEEIEFSDVSFQYSGNSKVIKIPEFHIKKGEKICIMGKSGGGKTTFLNLFTNFIHPDSGERLVDKRNYKEVGETFFEEKMSVISQEIELFNISLKENIALGQTVTSEEIDDILKKLDLLSWVEGLEKGLNTTVGEKGIRLSAGQRQRINLMRGILLDREIMILDEPTSHLDTATQKKVVDFLGEYLKDKTAIIVSHHEELKEVCDRCYTMKGHTLTETKGFE